eukprot:TRINITY_DN3565_c0_g2_i1.p1 TRINITY_DN3565_c0_g2~~TRINITY_DN3565_c0_g2_i1.p1  ORF type:complete len:624 (+),score=112.52 TRINITY_DN3565_c0_g2_i1:200-2071(+)
MEQPEFEATGVIEQSVITVKDPADSLGIVVSDSAGGPLITGIEPNTKSSAMKLAGAVPLFVRQIGNVKTANVEAVSTAIKTLRLGKSLDYPITYERALDLHTLKLLNQEQPLNISVEPSPQGVLIVQTGGASHACGLRKDNIIVTLDGVRLQSAPHFKDLIIAGRQKGALSFIFGTLPVSAAPLASSSKEQKPTAPPENAPPVNQQHQQQQQQQQGVEGKEQEVEKPVAPPPPPPNRGQPQPRGPPPGFQPDGGKDVNTTQQQPTGRDDGPLVVPAMPMFEPAQDAQARTLLEKAMSSSKDLGGKKSDIFTFPADVNFWDNFKQQSAFHHETSEREPYYHLSASHDDVTVKVNQNFVRAFVGGWEQQNPHTVTTYGPHGAVSFHASNEFWHLLEDTLGDTTPTGDTMLITTDKNPNKSLSASPRQWNDVCNQWEQTKGITPAERNEKMKLRQKQLDAMPRKKPQKTQGTQYVDPKQFIFLDEIPKGGRPTQSRSSPYTSKPPTLMSRQPHADGCTECGYTPPCKTCGHSPGRVGTTAANTPTAPRDVRAGSYSYPRRVSPSRPFSSSAVGRYLSNSSPAGRSSAPSSAYWDSFVREWEGVAANVQRSKGLTSLMDGTVDSRDI